MTQWLGVFAVVAEWLQGIWALLIVCLLLSMGTAVSVVNIPVSEH